MPDDLMRAEQGPRKPPLGDATEYKPKPPLWCAAFEKPASRVGIVAGLALAALVTVILVLLPDGSFLNIPIGQVEVRVVRVIGGAPADEAPASFRHVVSLADGTEGLFVAEHLHRPGTRLVVTASRSRLTGWISLRPPYRVLSFGGTPPSVSQNEG